MDMSQFRHGSKVVLGGAIVFLIVSIFNWQEVEFAGIASAGVSMWHGWGVLVGLLLIALILWEAARLAKVNIELPLSQAMVTTALAVLILLFTIIKFLADNEFRTFWAWLGLLLSIVIVVFAVQLMAAGGESLGDMKKSMTAAASSAATAAKGAAESATDRGADSTAETTEATSDADASGDEPKQSA